MAVIPGCIFQAVERQLHRCSNLSAEPREHDQDIMSASLGGGQGYACASASRGSHGDRTAKAALAQDAVSRQLEHEASWMLLVSQVRAIFYGHSEELLFERYYGSDLSIKELAAQSYYDRQTINRYREKVVSHCALLAMQRGLLRWEPDRDAEMPCAD